MSLAEGKTQVAPVPLLDLERENLPLMEEIRRSIDDVLRTGQFVLGPACQTLESEFAELCGVPHAVGCASGSDALLLSLMAIGIQPGDEVIVPSFTFFATASAVARLGAKPVFIDICESTFNLDPNLLHSAISDDTRAIIPVHLFGQCADINPIREIAVDYHLHVIEDCAQSVGATYHDAAAGSMGTTGCFSFYPTKNLGGCGDGGIVTTSQDHIAEQLRLFRAHGMQPRYVHHEVGINSRLDSIQAAVILAKLPYLAEWTRLREKNAERYFAMFGEAGLDREIVLPALQPAQLQRLESVHDSRAQRPTGRPPRAPHEGPDWHGNLLPAAAASATLFPIYRLSGRHPPGDRKGSHRSSQLASFPPPARRRTATCCRSNH